MNSPRLEQLKKFLKEDPNDPFNLYAIATEYRDTNPAQALVYYEQLLEQHAEYLPTYYHAAKLYEESGLREQAETTYRKGIALAQKQQNQLALRELQNAYNEFLFDE